MSEAQPEAVLGVRQDRPEGSEEGRQAHPRSAAEWVTLAAVLLILGTVVGYLLMQTLQTTADSARFTVEVRSAAIEQQGDRFYVPLILRNIGSSTAEEVVVRAELKQGDETLEETELTFSFVAGGEEMEGVAVFSEDPRGGQLEAFVVSYLKP